MNFPHAEFIGSAVHPSQYPQDGLPEIALAGRSNVGKSSFINSMLNRKNLARISSKPGKTQTLNFYRVGGRFYFVDLPGYGYAEVSKKDREAWGAMIERYIKGRKTLLFLIQLVDIRHPPSGQDRQMREWIVRSGIPSLVVATKADKISRGRWQAHLNEIKKILSLTPADPLFPYSSETKVGREEVWSLLLASLPSPPSEQEKSPDSHKEKRPPFG
ncbi:MAG: YihA family ribosome biogenesis GTP-binding protein [Thermicanus sp.]|nr:YihA family ribosome biogenesis GTP-binding protein [Thermicanus sp.]